MNAEQQEQQQETTEVSAEQGQETVAAPAQPAETTETPTEPTVSQTEAQLAAEALAATETEPETTEPMVPGHVVAGIRAERRALRQLTEQLQTELDNRNRPAEQTPGPSPAQQFIAEGKANGTFDPDTDPLPASIQLAEANWKEQQAQVKAQQQADQQQRQLNSRSITKAKSEIADFEDIVELGTRYLDDGDKLMIRKSADPAMELYKRCMKRTLESGGADAALLRQNLKAKSQLTQPVSSTKKPTETTQTQTTQPTGQRPAQPPTEEQEPPMTRELAQAYAILGM